MNQEQIELMKHCIGLDNKKPYIRHGKKFYRPYRNYYFTGAPDEEWDIIVSAGYANHGEQNTYGGYTYWLTRKGLNYLGVYIGATIYDY